MTESHGMNEALGKQVTDLSDRYVSAHLSIVFLSGCWVKNITMCQDF